MRVPFVADDEMVIVNELNWLRVRFGKRIEGCVDREADEFYVFLWNEGDSVKRWNAVYSEVCKRPLFRIYYVEPLILF